MSDDAKPVSKAAEALIKLNNDVKALSVRQDALNEQAKADKLSQLELAEMISELNDQVEKVTKALFVMLSMHLDLVAPKRDHANPEVAEEANEHTQLSLQGQARIMPEAYEHYYGVSAETGEVLPGRTPGVPAEES